MNTGALPVLRLVSVAFGWLPALRSPAGDDARWAAVYELGYEAGVYDATHRPDLRAVDGAGHRS